MMASHFYVTLPSNSSYEYFPRNTLSSFTTQLAEPIVLSGNWEVALCEIQYPFNWHNVTYKNCSMLLNERNICLPEGYYDTIQEIIDAFHDSLTPAETSNVKLHLNKHSFKTAVRVKRGYSLALQGLSQMFGFLDHNKICTEGFNIGDVVSDVHNGVTSFFVYSDIVDHQRVGDAHVPLLRVVKIGDKRPGEHITVSYTNPHYIPVRSRMIENIQIDLRDDLGQLIPFQLGRVIVKLHFKQSKSSLFT